MLLNTILIFLSIIFSGAIIMMTDWRWRVVCLAVIQILAFVIIVRIWPIALASVKLVSGWMGVVLISATMSSSEMEKTTNTQTSEKILYLMMIVFSWVIITASVDRLNAWLPIDYTNLFVGLVFFLCGIIFICVFSETDEITIGLLTLLTGFDIIYSSLEGSALVTGIYGLIIILLSLVGSYLKGGFSFGGTK